MCICRGTACHTRGSRNLLQTLRLELGLQLEDCRVMATKPTSGADDVRTRGSRCARWRASGNARWLRWWK